MMRHQSGSDRGKVPPRGALWLLRRLVPADMADVVLEDLSELYQEREEDGGRSAGLWFWGQTALFCARFSWEGVVGGGSGLGKGSKARRGAEAGPAFSGGGTAGWSVRSRQALRRLARDWRYSLGIVIIAACARMAFDLAG